MGVSLPAAHEKTAAVEAMFDRISADYDRMNRLMTFGMDASWRRHTIAALDLAQGDRAVDVGCGTGDLSLACATAGASTVGVDRSSGMLTHASRRRDSERENHKDVTVDFVRADAQALPLANASVEAFVSGFALRNFTDLGVALDEAARVLADGGRIALLEVDTPPFFLLRVGHRFWFNFAVPLLGRLFADPEAYSYLPKSVVYLPPGAELEAMLERRGFAQVKKKRLMFGAVQLLTAIRLRIDE
ncbi:MAG: demethylmenaquinone methyltransferase/2-methoxy-6-polyprenyl-1,4-benzoquinol methylase [Hyphomicrobiaceae bacterium]|jgi:demethylmenaquinone methyltransferase/2-methoxy-6-polyprenyl-1,4-benzoquinol methylase